MTRPDDHLERLINRKLDGELTEDDSLELDKCLIRDPATRQSLEESERIDRLTAALLEEVCAVQDEVTPPSDNRTVARRRMRWFGALPAAAAACVALFFMWPMFSPSSQDLPDSGGARAAHVPADVTLPIVAPDPDPQYPAAKLASYPDRPAKLRPLREHGTRLNYYGVLDPETQKLYMLEVKHQTSTQRLDQQRRRGAGQGGVQLASHEM
jgi:hypothetical protein